MALTDHHVTAALLGRPLIASASAQALVEERERALGIRFPASVREWYSVGEAVALLAGYRNMDHPVLLGELGAVVRDWHGTGRQDLVATGLLVFLVRTSMSPVAVRLDGADDPEVLVWVVDATPDRGWRRGADRFSPFIYTHVWEWGGGFWGDECSVQAQGRALDQTDLALLRCRLIEGPRTHGWPGRTAYRFSDGNARILIWVDEERQADWILWPRPRRNSPDSLSRFGSAARWRANYVPSASAARRR